MEYIQNILAALLVLFACVIILAKISAWKDAKEARLRGYQIDYISPGLLRAGEDQFGMSYHQDGVTLLFVGHGAGGESVLDLTSIRGNDETQNFYHTHKDLIQDRMRNELSTKWKRARITLKT